jgi:hypothetical protein
MIALVSLSLHLPITVLANILRNSPETSHFKARDFRRPQRSAHLWVPWRGTVFFMRTMRTIDRGDCDQRDGSHGGVSGDGL